MGGNGRLVVVTGATGFVGRRLCSLLLAENWRVRALCRTPSKFYTNHRDASSSDHASALKWHASDPIDRKWVEGAYGIVNLVGENIAAERLTAERIEVLKNSRERPTRNLAKLASDHKLRFICSSAMGIYSREVMTKAGIASATEEREECLGDSPIANLVKDWEAAALEAGEQALVLRTPVVLGPGAHFFAELPPWPVPLATLIDSSIPLPWIHVDDACRVIIDALEHREWRGVVNMAPQGDSPSQGEVIGEIAKRRGQWLMPFNVPAWALAAGKGAAMATMLYDTPALDTTKLHKEFGASPFEFGTLAECLDHSLA